MKSVPEAPDAPAVLLDYDEVDDDNTTNAFWVYERIKVLTEDGKKFANQELRYSKSLVWGENGDENYTDIAGRTVHADGTIIPFTGTPFERTITKAGKSAYVAKVFTLPDVQVGSILEFRYSYKYSASQAFAPDWILQQNLYMKHGHFRFIPSPNVLVRGESGKTYISNFQILPPGAHVDRASKGSEAYSMDVSDIPPVPDEDFMPPLKDFTYRVNFYYIGYGTIDGFWAGEGKESAKYWDEFSKANSKSLKEALASIGGTDLKPEDKLRQIYALVENMENTDFARERSRKENKVLKLKEVKNAEDVLRNKEGSSGELTLLFIGLARTAGFKAYAMAVTDRSQSIFNKQLPRWNQMDDMIAIVNVDGKEMFFDPGEPFCKFGQLAWQHTEAAGVRETDGGTAIATSPFASYKQSTITRTAMLTVDPDGTASGTINVIMDGAPALEWRQKALVSDSVEMNTDLEKDMTDMLPTGAEVKVKNITNLKLREDSLVVAFDVKMPVASNSGKRMILSAEVFRSKSKPILTQTKRQTPVYFAYAASYMDLVKIKLPAGLSIESMPQKLTATYKNLSGYSNVSSSLGPDQIQVQRHYILGNYVFLISEYDTLRDYFSKIAQADQDVILLKQAR